MLKENNGQKKSKRGGRREGAGRKYGAKSKLPEEFKERWRDYSEEAIQFYRRHAAAHLQQFMLDMIAGRRPKLVLEAPPQHGKSRLVHDFVTWTAGHQPDWPTIYASYSDELGTTANLRVQRTIELPGYQTIFRGRTKMASAALRPRPARISGCTASRSIRRWLTAGGSSMRLRTCSNSCST